MVAYLAVDGFATQECAARISRISAAFLSQR
jgi:hypothetical protein